MTILQSVIGVLIFCIIAWLCSEQRRQINYKWLLRALIVQTIITALVVKVAIVRSVFVFISRGIIALQNSTYAGTSFVFGYLGGGAAPFLPKEGGNTFILVFQALPMIMVISAISMLLFHLRVLPFIVKLCSLFFKKILGVEGALNVFAATKIFFGQTESPLFIAPYIANFSRNELFTVMTAGMTTASVSIMTLYATILEKSVANPMVHILTSAVTGVLSAIIISRIVVPPVKREVAENTVDISSPYNFSNAMDAILHGTFEGMKMIAYIAAMLVVMLTFIDLLNKLLSMVQIAGNPCSLQLLLGYVMAPIAWSMGIPWSEAFVAGGLIGTKAILTEIPACIGLAALDHGVLSQSTSIMLVYALCNFGNVGSIAILLSVLSTIAPSRKAEVVSMGGKALVASILASCMSATIVGLVLGLFP